MQNNEENIVCPKSESAAQQQRVLNLRIANIYHSYNNKKDNNNPITQTEHPKEWMGSARTFYRRRYAKSTFDWQGERGRMTAKIFKSKSCAGGVAQEIHRNSLQMNSGSPQDRPKEHKARRPTNRNRFDSQCLCRHNHWGGIEFL